MSERAEHCSGNKCWWPGYRGNTASKNRSRHSRRLPPVQIQAENHHSTQQKLQKRSAVAADCDRGVAATNASLLFLLAPIRTQRVVHGDGGAASLALASSRRCSQPAPRLPHRKIHPSSTSSTVGRNGSWKETKKTNQNKVTVSVNICPGRMATSKDDDEAEGDHVVNKRSSSTESSDSSEHASESSSEPASSSAPSTLPPQRASLCLRWDSIDNEEPKCRDFGIRDYLTATNESIDAEEESSMAGDFNTGLGVPPPRFSIDSLDATTALLLDTHVTERNSLDHDRLTSGRSARSLRKSLSLPHAAATFSPNLPKIHEIQKISVATPPEDSSSHEQQFELRDMDTIRSQKRRVTVDMNTTSGRRCDTWEG